MREIEKTNYIAQKLTGILDIIICLLLFISSIYKGAFYKADFLFPNVVITIIGAIYLVNKIIKEIIRRDKDVKTRSKINMLLDLFMLIMPVAYALPIIFKTYVSLPDSIYELLRYINFTVIYFIVKETKNPKTYLNIFVAISVLQCILGMDQLTFRAFENLLNRLSTGYLEDQDRLSATIQYANVTGTVISLGTIICFNKITSILKHDKQKNIKIMVTILFVILQITSIVFTRSRIAVISTIVILVLNSLHSYMLGQKDAGFFKFGLLLYSFISSAIVEKAITNKNFYFAYALFFILPAIFYIIFCLVRLAAYKFTRLNKYVNNKKYVKYAVCIFVIIAAILILPMPKKLVIRNDSQANISVSRNIYNFKNGKNICDIEIEKLSDDATYKIEIYELKKDYRFNKLAVLTSGFNDAKMQQVTFDLDDETRKLNVVFNVTGEIKVTDFKMNEKSVKLSYMIIPDTFMNKIVDTFYGVYGDSLRLEYAKDSFKLLMRHPIIGVGGEGFKHTYGTVQTHPYVSSEAHSAILQSMVEVGIFGTIILIAIIILSLIVSFKLFIRLKKIQTEDQIYILTLIYAYLSLLVITIFDLAFSYAFMIYVFATVLALLRNAYINLLSKYNERKEEKSKIDWSYIKIIVLSISLVCFIVATYFSINAYRATFVKKPNRNADINISQIEENIAYLELKVSEDKYDTDYLKELYNEYEKYKTQVRRAYINIYDDTKLKEQLKNKLNDIAIKTKNIADKMLEYEYYDKFVLRDVADIYMNNYIIFAEIYEEQFSSKEVAYAFYLNYAVKLTDRIIELNPISKKANEMYSDMYKRYLDKLKSDNKYLSSVAVKNVISLIEEKIT